MAVTGHALNQLLQQMDRTFSNVTGQSVSFIDQEGHYQGPLRLDVFTGFCRRVISSEKGAQHCLACNHSFGLDAEQRCTVSQCHMGISVISVPVPLPEARGLSLTYGQFLTRDTEEAFYSTLRRHCQELELDYDEMVALAGTLRVLSAEELDARMQMLQVFAGSPPPRRSWRPGGNTPVRWRRSWHWSGRCTPVNLSFCSPRSVRTFCLTP